MRGRFCVFGINPLILITKRIFPQRYTNPHLLEQAIQCINTNLSEPGMHGNFQCYETHLPPILQFMMDREIYGMGTVRITGLSAADQLLRCSTCDLEFNVLPWQVLPCWPEGTTLATDTGRTDARGRYYRLGVDRGLMPSIQAMIQKVMTMIAHI